MQDLRGPGAGAVNFATGVATELAKQGGANWAQGAAVGGLANKAGHKVVHSAAKMAPAAIAGAGALVAAAPAVAVVVGAAAVGVGAVCLGRWIARKMT